MPLKMLCAEPWIPDRSQDSQSIATLTTVIHTLIISQALIQQQDGVSLHPDFLAWEKNMAAYKKTWFACADKTPLAWYGALCDVSPAALLAGRCRLPTETAQCWVVSPYYAQLLQTKVRVYPEGLFPWSAADADALCSMLNPLLAEEGMQLQTIGAALLLSCRKTIDASPLGFGAISAQLLPDQHHEGRDGGRLNRLLSEIQMLLFQSPLSDRQARGDVAVSGLWLCSPMQYSAQTLNVKSIAVATRNPALQSIVDGKDAVVMITEVERLHTLWKQDVALPKRIVLAGAGHAVLLRKSMLPRFAKKTWIPKSIKPESTLFSMLQSIGMA